MVVQPVRFIRWLYPQALWRVKTVRREVYLTFDDGPVPEATPWVLDLLKKKDVKATFFCVGQNVERHPAIYQRILDEGHAVGNHTHNHVKAWVLGHGEYLDNVKKAVPLIGTRLFRPPHGQLWPWSVKGLKRMFDKIVMWDVLSFDYNKKITSAQVLGNVKQYTRNGSVIVFHDSIKAWPHMHKVLPEAIDWLLEQGYQFRTLE
ncbi:MAG: polysaccharide deacetylase family protein [Breznakibacter sp.]